MAKQTVKRRWPVIQRRLFTMVSVGVIDEPVNQGYDIVSTTALIVNLVVSILNTFDHLSARYGVIFGWIEEITVAFFALDFVLRLLTAKLLYPTVPASTAVRKYMFSFSGVVDLLSFFPYYLPFFFPVGAAVFRMVRVVRILRLFRINAYYDSLNVITEVLSSKKQQLMSSVFMILVLMMAASLCMYSIEHNAQPEVFQNAFSGIWWAASTLLTVGYGDIYPVTMMGKFMGILITFLGVGMVAIPTGIISAGFVEQYTRLKQLGDYTSEQDVHFIKVQLSHKDAWVGKQIKEIGLPHGTIIAVIQRGAQTLIPRGHVILQPGDVIVIGAEALKYDQPVDLKEIQLGQHHKWNGVAIKDLDISRQTFIVMVERRGKMMIPRGEQILCAGDKIILYTKVAVPKDME